MDLFFHTKKRRRAKNWKNNRKEIAGNIEDSKSNYLDENTAKSLKKSKIVTN